MATKKPVKTVKKAAKKTPVKPKKTELKGVAKTEDKASYTAKDIYVLEGLEPVRKRPGMYIGSTGPSGLHQLIREATDNSIDEAMAGEASNVEVRLMKDGKVDLVLFGADRIARNGDVANKIGSYGLAALARLHKVPCYAVAPSSTFDLSLDCGVEIEIELRKSQEILHIYGYSDKLLDVANVYNPAFDITPAEFLSGIITEKGILKDLNLDKITKFIQ